MNVLQVSKYYYPEVGGIEQVVRSTAEGLAHDHDVRVLAASSEGRGGTRKLEGVSVETAPTLGEMWSVPISPTFPIRLARGIEWADIVHVHLPNPTAVVSYLGAMALHRGSRDHALVATYHSDIVRQSTALSLYRPLLDRFLGQVDRIIATSPRLVECSDMLGAHEARCVSVPLAVDLSARTSSEGAADHPGERDRQTVLFVGRLRYYKGVEYLLDAMARLDADADLLVVGDGEERPTLERLATTLGVDDAVSFLGYVSDDILTRCYETADLFVLPSVAPSEAFGVVQLEAMAHGIPVVNTNLPTGVPWVSPDGETGRTVPPKDAPALADAIDELLADPDRRQRLGEIARTRVETQFSRERRLDRITAVYDDVTGGGSGLDREDSRTGLRDGQQRTPDDCRRSKADTDAPE